MGADAVVYLLVNESLSAVKIGVTGPGGIRLKRHMGQGWRVLGTRVVPGDIALAIESEILTWWHEEMGLQPFVGPEDMPYGGWTETVDAKAIDLAATWLRIESRPLVAVDGSDMARADAHLQVD
jgi:hypothetical protein